MAGGWGWCGLFGALACEVVDDVEGLGPVIDDKPTPRVHLDDGVDFLHVLAFQQVGDGAGVCLFEVESAEFVGAVNAAVVGVQEANGLVVEGAPG